MINYVNLPSALRNNYDKATNLKFMKGSYLHTGDITGIEVYFRHKLDDGVVADTWIRRGPREWKMLGRRCVAPFTFWQSVFKRIKRFFRAQ